jgi:hypothetical protein
MKTVFKKLCSFAFLIYMLFRVFLIEGICKTLYHFRRICSCNLLETLSATTTAEGLSTLVIALYIHK